MMFRRLERQGWQHAGRGGCRASVVAGQSVQGHAGHDNSPIHFGAKSGDAFKNAKDMNLSCNEMFGWFDGQSPLVPDAAPGLLLRDLAGGPPPWPLSGLG
jgi:hypothetical protein